jgi:hypothetical protein
MSSIPWSAIMPGIRDLIARCAAVSVAADPMFEAFWTERAQPYQSPSGIKIDLSLNRVRGKGQDERRHEQVTITPTTGPAFKALKSWNVGNRVLRFELRCETFDHTDTLSAFTVSDEIRTRLRLPSSLEALTGLGLGLARVGDSADFTYTRDGRRVSASVSELEFNCAANVYEMPDSWIETVLVRGTVVGPNGATITQAETAIEQPADLV